MDIDLTPSGLAKGNFLEISVDDKLRDAQAALRDRDLPTALDRIGEALLAGPERLDVLSTYADIAVARGSLVAAVGIAEAAVEHNPEHADALIMLAQRRVQAGRTGDAVAAAQAATRVQPTHTGAHQILADLLWRQNRIAESLAADHAAFATGTVGETEALRAAARAVSSGRSGDARAVTAAAHAAHPESERLAVLHGQACLADGAPSEALTASEAVAARDKGQDLACVRARALIDCGRPLAALDALDGWGDHGQRQADVLVLHAVALRLSGHLRAARSAYAEAMRIAGVLPRLQLGHAVCLRELGLKREALNAMDRMDGEAAADASSLHERAHLLAALGRRPEAVEATQHAVMSGGSGDLMDGPAFIDADIEPAMDLAGLRAILAGGALSADEAIGYRFALGHAESAQGNDVNAMRAWDEANSRVRARFRFDVADFAAWLRRVPAITGDWRAGPARESVADAPNLVFIVGMPRSGTSLTEQVLAAHPDVWPGGEATTVTTLIDTLTRCYPDTGYPDVLRRLGDAELADLRRYVLAQIAAQHPGARVVTDKMPGNFVHLGLLARLFPDAVLVTCQRNPLDTALSIYTQWFREGHLYAYAMDEIAEVLAAHRDVMGAWATQVPPAQCVGLRYEDLVTSPQTTIARLLRACDLSHADACFAPWRHVRHVESGSARRVHRPITADRVDRWSRQPERLQAVRRRLDIAAT